MAYELCIEMPHATQPGMVLLAVQDGVIPPIGTRFKVDRHVHNAGPYHTLEVIRLDWTIERGGYDHERKVNTLPYFRIQVTTRVIEDAATFRSQDRTMHFSPPEPVVLTQDETALLARIPNSPESGNWRDGANAMERLVKSMLHRDAVPPIRFSLFEDPKYAETGSKSPFDYFKSKGNDWRATIRHGSFIPYLHHIIYGPDLPKAAIEGLCKILNDDMGTSGMLLDQYCKHARDSVRKHRLSRHNAATEFFRLGVEIGMDVDAARILRRAALNTR